MRQKRVRRSQGRQGVRFVDNGRQQQSRTAPVNDLEAQNNLRSSQPINIDVEVEGNYERSMISADQTRMELLSPASSNNGYEEVSRVAATLYIEMKKCIKGRNL